MTLATDIEARVADAVPEPLAKVGPLDIGPLFGHGRHWFNKYDVRRRLRAEGFPRAVGRGIWLKRDVVRFVLLKSAGMPTLPVEAGTDEPLDQVIDRTREHLDRKRRERGRG